MNFIKFNTIAPTWMLSLPLTSENWQKYLKFKVDSWFFSSVLLWDLQIFAKLLLIWWSSDCRRNLPLICCQITTRLLPGILPDYYQICCQIRHQFYYQITTRFVAKFVINFTTRLLPDLSPNSSPVFQPSMIRTILSNFVSFLHNILSIQHFLVFWAVVYSFLYL